MKRKLFTFLLIAAILVPVAPFVGYVSLLGEIAVYAEEDAANETSVGTVEASVAAAEVLAEALPADQSVGDAGTAEADERSAEESGGTSPDTPEGSEVVIDEIVIPEEDALKESEVVIDAAAVLAAEAPEGSGIAGDEAAVLDVELLEEELVATLEESDVEILAEEGLAIDATNFPDPGFLTYLKGQDYADEGILTADEIADITSMTVRGADRSVRSLEGVKYFTALKELIIRYQGITELPELPSGLEVLSVNTNWIYSLPENLSISLPSLKTLGCAGNYLTELPELPSGLELLSCYNNQLTSLPGLPPSLTYVNCSTNHITSVDLSGLALENFGGIGQTIALTAAANGSVYNADIGLNSPVFENAAVTYADGNIIIAPSAPAFTAFSVGTGKAGCSLSGTMTFTYTGVFAVEDISGILTSVTEDETRRLNARVSPEYATYKEVVWSVASRGTTDARITNGNRFYAGAAGTARITATVANGNGPGEDYTETFTITVIAAPETGGGGTSADTDTTTTTTVTTPATTATTTTTYAPAATDDDDQTDENQAEPVAVIPPDQTPAAPDETEIADSETPLEPQPDLAPDGGVTEKNAAGSAWVWIALAIVIAAIAWLVIRSMRRHSTEE